MFAAYAAYSDNEIGRVIQHFQDLGKLDNTLIIYINGDNGTSAEGGPTAPQRGGLLQRCRVQVPVEVQTKRYDAGAPIRPTTTCRPAGRGPSTRRFVVQAERLALGGVNQNMWVSWPACIKAKGALREQFVHVIDVVPTILEAAGIKAP